MDISAPTLIDSRGYLTGTGRCKKWQRPVPPFKRLQPSISQACCGCEPESDPVGRNAWSAATLARFRERLTKPPKSIRIHGDAG